ncbi:CHAT domain-containing protein [Actinoplanes bogorensis]|uniref:CHAT domain-containing protein n=1 Tax=Paractinoplanes bogorensis TaxID=1610840 RepID=A0ABS5Z3M7_9ACTN|nr:tetratricopeptide repeat protein [Actinoplanes bogorensis]MBU2670247.1 CHAT domain-containing protein [Actinoplanes bogorensis]
MDIGRQSRSLFRAWSASDRAAGRALLDGVEVPAPIALRSRYRHLHDTSAPDGPLSPGLDETGWQAVFDLETAGDLAVQSGRLDRAAEVFAELAGLETTARHRVVLVHARIGAGDVARARDLIDEAISAYEEALSIAVSDGYRFGELRACVPLGYLALAYSSGATAEERFRRAETLAAELGDPLYGANAALGLAECAERGRDLDGAIAGALAARNGFAEVGSPIGRANAAHRAGALLHRARRLDEAAPLLEEAHGLYLEIGDPVGLSNTLSGLGDLYLDRREFEVAERWFGEGLRQAESAGLRRARAHALQDMARLSRGRGDWPRAITEFGRALAAYREIDDIGGVWHALDKTAEGQAELGLTADAVHTRMEAILSIEEFRAGHRDEQSQREYRDRFGLAYSRALAAAVAAGDAAAFVVVADCLAGRRLAGLIEHGAPDGPAAGLDLLQGLLVRADQRLVSHRHDRDTTVESTREQRIRLLGAFGVRHGLAEPAKASLDDQLAAVYLPPERDGGPLLAAVADEAYLLEILADPAQPDLVRWLWRRPGHAPAMGSSALDQPARSVLAALTDAGERAALSIEDLAPLAAVVPAGLRAALLDDPDPALLIVPIGEWWMVPWSALPLDDEVVLGERARYAVCPSLTVQRGVTARRTPASGTTADVWRSPFVSSHDLSRVGPERLELRPLATSSAARERLRDGGELMVVIGHGRPAPGLGHYLELDRDDWLTPADLIGASTPRRLALVACEAASIEGRRPSDPVSLATLALAARSDEVLATLGELSDTEPAARYVDDIISAMAGSPLPEALRRATRTLLATPGLRYEPLVTWAPLVAIGTVR